MKKILQKYYFLTKAFSHLSFSLKYRQENLLIVYQMGKVGSSSMVASLQASDLKMPVLQVHFLSPEAIKEVENRYYGPSIGLLQDSLWPETRHLFLSYFLRHTLNSKRSQPKWKVISLIRDPVARSASVFFYSVDTPKQNPYLPDFYKKIQKKTLTLPMLIEYFHNALFGDPDEFQLPLRYFDNELKPVLDIDVFKYKFPKQRGYAIYESEYADLLLIKLEKIKDCIKDATREFLGLSDFQLINANLSSQKRYYPIYKEFLGAVKFPRNYLENIYNSKYMHHFYTNAEIEAFYRKWSQ